LRPSLNLRASRDLLSFGFGHSLAQLGLVLSQQSDNLVVGRWLGPAALGIYGRAYNLMVLPATVFGKIVNRVLFPIMAQVQNERERLAGGYERALAIVALVSLPVSATLWIVAPEFIPALLGPKWTAVVLPFRLFTISLFFRMSSKVSDACTKAAGAVYSRALIQGIYAAMVFVGALIGQRWGIGGVAIAVSIVMGINWMMMAALGQKVTGLSWARFLRAHSPSVLFAALLAVGVGITVQAARASHLGKVGVLAVAGLTCALELYAASRLWPELLLGPHGAWASRQAFATARGFLGRLSRLTGAGEGLPTMGKPGSK
jgi:PST family polysaccharide transporter